LPDLQAAAIGLGEIWPSVGKFLFWQASAHGIWRGIEQSEDRSGRIKMKREAGNLDLITGVSHLEVHGFP
jgi:hypothetical protein